MQKASKIAVIGAGLAGLTAARALADRGYSVVVYDKGRGLGGRMASRRKDGWRFDHGAVVLSPTDVGFADFIAKNETLGFAARWQDGDGWTGLPGMSGFVKATADVLTIHTQAEVTRLERVANGWTLHVTDGVNESYDHVILAIPQPQAHRLLSGLPNLQAQIGSAEMDPCWTLMVGFDKALPTGTAFVRNDDGPLRVLSRDAMKPGRELPGDGWVIQASAAWSRTHLERAQIEIEALLLKLFFAEINCTPVAPVICMAHRWRYAFTSKSLGQAYLNDETAGFSVCGDWCLGNTAQDAFNSGRALAETLISQWPRD